MNRDSICSTPPAQRRGRSLARLLALALLLFCAFSVATVIDLPTAEAVRRTRVSYKIKKGDTLGKIARRYRVTIKQLRRWNRLKGDRIVAGQRLRIAPPVSRKGPALVDAVQMPEGDGYYLKNADESWGTARTIGLFREVFSKYHERFPDSVDLVVGDISRKEGGYFPPHRSHRTGRDIDIGLPVKGNRPLKHFWSCGKHLDVEKSWALLEMFLETGQLELVFLDIRHQRRLYKYAERQGVSKSRLSRIFQWPRSRRTRAGLVRHSRGHDDHFHIRLTKAPPAVASPAQPEVEMVGPPVPAAAAAAPTPASAPAPAAPAPAPSADTGSAAAPVPEPPLPAATSQPVAPGAAASPR